MRRSGSNQRFRPAMLGTAFVAVGALGALAACGSSGGGGGGSSTGSGGGSSSGSKSAVILGTTDTPVTFDPAGAYDLPSWTGIYNIYQGLLKVPAGTSDIEPDAATCKFSNPTTYVCTLKPNQKFSNGDPVTGQDVVYSFERVVKIKDPAGPSSLLTPMKSVSASGNTVTFTLNAPDAVWPYILTTGAGAIVDHKVFPFDKELDSSKVVGSGPYELSAYTPKQDAEFTPNPHYAGDDKLANSKFVIRYEQDASTLVSDVQQGSVDIAYRTLDPTQLQALNGKDGVSLVQGQGIEMRYLVFNEKLMPGSSAAQKLAIRKAAAMVVDRQSIAQNVYKGTVKPLYSLIPQGLNGATTSFESAYGAGPDVAKAKTTLQQAGVQTPISITLNYNVNHYSDNDLATELQRELDGSGLFKVTLKNTDWATYEKTALSDGYPVFLFGWFPDYPDADDYTSPFLPCKSSFLEDHFCNPTIDKLIGEEEKTTDKTKRDQEFAQIQQLTAAGVPVVPIWQGGQVAAVRSGVTGVQATLDPSYTFRFWLVGKSS